MMRRMQPSDVYTAGLVLLQALLVVSATSTAVLAAGPPEQNTTTGQQVTAPQQWLDPEGHPLPFQDHAEIVDFLRHATVVSTRAIGTGVTNPQQLLLEASGIQAHAIFRYGDTNQRELRRPGGGTARWVHDSYLNEVVAFELAQLLGIDNVPPTVERTIDGVPGSVQLWIEGTVTEGDQLNTGQQPKDLVSWHRQVADRQVFDELIGNVDRNQGNTLIDPNGRLWLIDHTRAFGRQRALLDPERITRCSRRLWQGLQALDERVVTERLLPTLGKQRLRSLLARHSKLIERIEAEIARRGEAMVIFSYGASSFEIVRPPTQPPETDHQQPAREQH